MWPSIIRFSTELSAFEIYDFIKCPPSRKLVQCVMAFSRIALIYDRHRFSNLTLHKLATCRRAIRSHPRCDVGVATPPHVESTTSSFGRSMRSSFLGLRCCRWHTCACFTPEVIVAQLQGSRCTIPYQLTILRTCANKGFHPKWDKRAPERRRFPTHRPFCWVW